MGPEAPAPSVSLEVGGPREGAPCSHPMASKQGQKTAKSPDSLAMPLQRAHSSTMCRRRPHSLTPLCGRLQKGD